VVAWIAKYAPQAESSWLRSDKVAVEYLEYSWNLNDVKQ
jgi:hypothetical protein